MAKKLNVPPFPPLEWDGYSWAGELTLPSWAGFQARRGGYGSLSSEKPSDGTAGLTVGVEDDNAHPSPTPAQVQAMQHLLGNERKVAAAVLQALFEHYPSQKAAYEDTYDEEESATLPDIADPDGLRTVLGLANVHVLTASKDGVAYIGFEFGCAWDSEHGAGVMTHLGRVVTVGGADCSFLEWIAEEDAEKTQDSQ